MEIKLRKGFKERVQARFDRFEMEVGIIQDGPHKEPKLRAPGEPMNIRGGNIGSYAGGDVRKLSNIAGPLTLAQVSAANRERLGFNYLSEPFKHRNSDIIKFSEAFFKMASGRSSSLMRRCENLLQAIVRNPILRGEYGRQSKNTTHEKGFYRPMIDTAQLFKAIKAAIRIRGGRV